LSVAGGRLGQHGDACVFRSTLRVSDQPGQQRVLRVVDRRCWPYCAACAGVMFRIDAIDSGRDRPPATPSTGGLAATGSRVTARRRALADESGRSGAARTVPVAPVTKITVSLSSRGHRLSGATPILYLPYDTDIKLSGYGGDHPGRPDLGVHPLPRQQRPAALRPPADTAPCSTHLTGPRRRAPAAC